MIEKKTLLFTLTLNAIDIPVGIALHAVRYSVKTLNIKAKRM